MCNIYFLLYFLCNVTCVEPAVGGVQSVLKKYFSNLLNKYQRSLITGFITGFFNKYSFITKFMLSVLLNILFLVGFMTVF